MSPNQFDGQPKDQPDSAILQDATNQCRIAFARILRIANAGGEKDTDWESDRNRVKRIEDALRKAGRKPQIHMFPGEGHSFSLDAEQKRKAIVDQFFTESLK